jgi:hypothetical protein
MAEQITDHVDAAIDRLPEQHKGKTKIEALISALTDPFQTLENGLWQLLTERGVDTAVGVQLTAIGDLVGEPRAGDVDDDYRPRIRARIATNKSTGTISDILTVSRNVVLDENITFVLQQQTLATVMLRLEGAAVESDLADILISFLRNTVSAGVRIILEYQQNPSSEILYLDIDNLDDEHMIPALD